MNRRYAWAAVVGTVVGITLLGVTQGGPADASSLSRGSTGWSAARQYFEALETPTETLDQPIAEGVPPSGVLVIAGAAVDRVSERDGEVLDRFLASGGSVILAYGDGLRIGEILGIRFARSTGAASSINPVVWQREAGRTHEYGIRGVSASISLHAVQWYPISRDGDEVLVRNASDEPIVMVRPRGQGEIVILPSEVLSNGRLQQTGNASLLESLRTRFGERTLWIFDEYHHGVARAASPAGRQSLRALDLFLVQIVLAYLLFAGALGRRFGPEWPEPRAASGATSAFLMTVAGVHDRLGHHLAAATALRERAREVLGLEVSRPRAVFTSAEAGRSALLDVAGQINSKQRERRIS